MDITVTDELLTTTRAVRRRLDLERPVRRDVVLDCLRVAIQAPTGANKQNWRWVVVDDPDVRASIAKTYAGHTLRVIERSYDTLDEQSKRVYDSARYLTGVLDRVPVLVIPCVSGRPDAPDAPPAAAYYGSIFPAIWSFQLALRSRGMGSVLTTPFVGRLEAEYAEILRLPATITPIALLPVAYTVGDKFKPAARRPIESVTHWNGWQE